jgi:hypothetical protein
MPAQPPSETKRDTASSSAWSGAWNKFLLKVKYSFYSMLVFVIFANPETFRITNSMLGGTVTGTGGLPTAFGFFLHSGLFFATMLGLMMLPSE